MTNNKVIFVTGGTGKQGGAVARNLTGRNFKVKVLTRNPESIQAQNLQKLNIEIIKGDLNDNNTYCKHLDGVYGVFSVQPFENGVNNEIKQGINLATIAKEMGVEMFLYSSVLGADLNSGVAHLESKFTIENYVKQSGLPFTIVRPSSFYENFLIPAVKKGIAKGKLVQPVKPDTILQYIAADDLGKIAAIIFENRDMYLGKTISLATEQLSTRQIAQLFTDVLNKPVVYKKLPALITRLFIGKPVYEMFRWMNKKNRFQIETVHSTRKEFPDLISLKTWIEMNFKS